LSPRSAVYLHLLVFALVITTAILPRVVRADVADQPSFSNTPETLRQAAALVKAKKDANVTILLNEERVGFDSSGKAVDSYHSIYRIENEDGVKGWAEVSSQWEPWHQSKPEIRARVITADGSEHSLDPATLTDVPVHENSPDTYSDQRAYGGPLPAIAVGSIIEEEIIVRDTAPFFTAGVVQRLNLAKSVAVNRTHIVFSHPETLPFHFVVREMPGATVRKSADNGIETIDIENGPMEAHSKVTYAPSDVAPGAQVEYSTGTSWQHIAESYARISNEKMRAADVQPLLAKLNLPSSGAILPRNQLITRLVTSLHRNIRYTGVEFGEASIIPQPPAETVKRKYGDCKDKAALLVTMLRASGVPANLALLDSGPGQDINTELPGMGMFDHAIVYVPDNGADGDLWIDATSQYSRVGDLPYMDYGRWALIVDEKTTALKKIPELTTGKNVHRESREFNLAEFGPAAIVERNEEQGPGEAYMRDTYSGENKELRENVENYLKRAYLAEKLTSLKHADVQDLSKQFWVSFTTSGKRGSTDYESATMAIRLEDLFNGFPDYFTTAEDEKPEPDTHQDDDDDSLNSDQHKPRTLDWEIRRFSNEWNYTIVAPPGFKLRALPPAKEEKLGTATLSQKYSSNPEGTRVEAVLRFESGKPRLTVAEAKVQRDAIVKARKSDAIFVVFDQVGRSLMAKGKIREGLGSYQQLIQLHPKEALHRIQLARALLSVGLGEKARVVAREATTLEPNSAQAFSTLAWILEHDLVGRFRKKGFDYDGALTAYRKAKQLDPKDKDVRVNLAILLEYDASGERYTAMAHLKEAVAEFAELKKMDQEYVARYDDNVLYDLWYARDLEGLKAAIVKLPATDTRRAFILAIAAADQGSAAALKKSLEVTTDDDGRSKALNAAGWLLIRVYKYSLASDLLAAAARGQSNEAQSAAYADMIRKAVPRGEFKIDSSVPNSIIQRFFDLMFSSDNDFDRMKALTARNANLSLDPKKDREDYRIQIAQLRQQLEKTGMPLQVIGDIAIPNMRFSSEGSDSPGYKITTIAAGAEPQHAFVVRENGAYKMLEMTMSAREVPHDLGWQALQELNNNNLAAARQWLDWAREQVHLNENDDPLAGEVFPHFWTKGHQGDAADIRRAALALVSSKQLKHDDFAALQHVRDASAAEEKSRIDLLLARGYRDQELWAELVPVAERLTAAYPDSLSAFQLAAVGYAGTRRLDDWQKLLDTRLAKHSDELDYMRSAAQLARYRGDFTASRRFLKTLIDSGKATASDLNSYAWDDLFVGTEINQDSIEAAERGNQLGKNSSFDVMHTLACLYARAGKPTQARDILLKAMDAANLDEPNSSVWLAYGVIAESVGEADAARQMFARVEKMKTEVPSSNYELAQQRLASLNKTTATASANEVH
jgi:Tfp pilus assembly protein PilF